MTISKYQHKKIAHLNAFYKSNCKGGGEKVSFVIRDFFKADLWAGAIGFLGWNPTLAGKDPFVAKLWDKNYNIEYLHKDSEKPIWRQFKRQWFFLFSPKAKGLQQYDLIIYGGNVGILPSRLKHISLLDKFLFDLVDTQKPKQILYCYTPPRPFTDQFEDRRKSLFILFRPLFTLLMWWVRWQYKRDLLAMDLVIADSKTIQNRLKTYFDVDSIVVYPPTETDKFQFLEVGDYFLSYGRLEPLKRIPLIIEAFAKMPNKKLIICSSGPLKSWLIEEIASKKLTNIIYEGLVSDERLKELVGKCLAGIYIPVNEDIGMIQTELMSAGKPVIGVQEGGLTETVIDGQTGFLIPANPSVEQLMEAVNKITPELASSMKEASIKQAQNFSSEVFYQKLDEAVASVLE